MITRRIEPELVRRLAPWRAKIGKRLVKSPRIYVRDAGITHALLGIVGLEDLLGHPVAGASWEGFVIETLVAAAPRDTSPYFFRTAAGAEIDLLLHLPGGALWARSSAVSRRIWTAGSTSPART